jgi:DNA processing protein
MKGGWRMSDQGCFPFAKIAPARPNFQPKDQSEDRQILAIALSGLEYLKPDERELLYNRLDGTAAFSLLSWDDLAEATGRRLHARAFKPQALLDAANKIREFCLRRGISLCVRDSADYPPQLRETYQAPFLLYWRGPFLSPESPCLGIVGTRDPSLLAFTAARDCARDASASGFTVVSGLALGIDRAAHEGSLEGVPLRSKPNAGSASNVRSGASEAACPTVAVLGCGIDAVYPSSHRPLAARILSAGGAIVSEYPPGYGPMRYRFPERNRVISGLSRAVIVAEAPAKSGALITADYALDQGRDLYVLRAGLSGERGVGSARLASEGATVLDSAAGILEEWSLR